jgi:lipopolysaccharide transport system permease protein
MSRRLQHHLDLFIVLLQKELKVRYKSSVLGYFWSIAQPMAFALVFFVAFKVVMRIQMEDYALFLLSGLFPWQWFANSVSMSPTVFLSNTSIIKKINFPREVLPFTTVLQDMIHFVLSMPVIVILLFVYHKSPALSWCYGIPILLVLQFVMTYGIALFIASINLFFRDLEKLTGIFITLLFYFTPVIYPETMIPQKYKHLVNLNPVAPLMVSWRNLFLHGTLDPNALAVTLFYSVVVFMAGRFVYQKLSWKFAEVL